MKQKARSNEVVCWPEKQKAFDQEMHILPIFQVWQSLCSHDPCRAEY